MTNDEAVHLNITDSMRIQPGEDFAVELGIIHNLHCLVRSLPYNENSII